VAQVLGRSARLAKSADSARHRRTTTVALKCWPCSRQRIDRKPRPNASRRRRVRALDTFLTWWSKPIQTATAEHTDHSRHFAARRCGVALTTSGTRSRAALAVSTVRLSTPGTAAAPTTGAESRLGHVERSGCIGALRETPTDRLPLAPELKRTAGPNLRVIQFR
jgi:hypothetical protein